VVPTPSITPPFTAFSEQNGSQDNANVAATFASGRPC